MTKLTWDDVGSRKYETGVDHGVLYIPNSSGVYDDGVAWNGLTTVTESPAGADANAQYADNIKYLNLIAAETFGGTLEAMTYPDEFAPFDGLSVPVAGVAVGQQGRKVFGLSYRTKIGNDVEGDSLGYKLHLLYGCQASPSEKAYASVSDSPAGIVFSWTISTTPVSVTDMKPTSLITIDSTVVAADDLAALETILYGTTGVDPALPTPDEVITLFTSGATEVSSVNAPTYVSGTHTLTIPTTTGIDYLVDGAVTAAGDIVLTTGQTKFVQARPKAGYYLADGIDNDWSFSY